MDGALPSAPLVDDAFRPQSTDDGTTTDHTLAWLVAQETTHGRAFYYSGSMEGTTALLYLIPSRRYALAVLANRERYLSELAPLLGTITDLILGPR